ncbi:MAG: metallophosphoesterase [Victivallaceae bacterium]|nr:metallophosphoesterase [Victivallaceae bacterium]
MKILCLSDLHRVIADVLALKEQQRWLGALLAELEPDVVLITGDVFESNPGINPYEDLHKLFNGITVICTLGNHEFVYTAVDRVLKNYRKQYQPGKWNVHYLDIIGHYDIGLVRFFGNVLWYDGSLATVPNQVLTDFAEGRWLDRTIVNFDPVAECEKCVEQIMLNQPEVGQIGLLATHCVPAREVNGHYQTGVQQPFDAFSGVSWLLDKVQCDYAISGHTHKRIIGKEINGIKCINSGNDYYSPFQHYLLEI